MTPRAAARQREPTDPGWGRLALSPLTTSVSAGELLAELRELMEPHADGAMAPDSRASVICLGGSALVATLEMCVVAHQRPLKSI